MQTLFQDLITDIALIHSLNMLLKVNVCISLSIIICILFSLTEIGLGKNNIQFYKKITRLTS